jgi:RHS repeat-associated protein
MAVDPVSYGATLRDRFVTATNIAGSADGTSAATAVIPHGPTTVYAYGDSGNIETQTDPNGNTTKYAYNADGQLTKTEEPNKTVTETEYDAMGQVTAQTDGNKHTTEYKRNLLEETTEEINPLGHKTKKEYDTAGNLVKLTDPTGRTTTYTYDPANRLTEVVYSSGNPATVKYEYNKDGDRTKMTDGTGTTKYEYDQLDRLTETENGHKEVVKYEYNLAGEQTKITYPNGKAVTRAFDKDGRLEKVTDWNGKETKFSYDPDSDLKATVFPSETKDEDTYAYNDAGEMSEVKMLKGTETLASLAYTRDNDGHVKKPTYEYDADSRLTKGAGIAYEYDSANNPTKIGSGTYKYNSGNELETGPNLTYTYNEEGQRTKTTPTTGPATTYGYDQAGDLLSVERPKEGEVAEIKDSYAYNGDGLRVSQTIAGTTTYMAWDTAEELPLLLSDGTNSYIYGPGGMPIEQISSGGTTSYLHHDQQGSTRLLTGSAGTVTGSYSYTPYGAVQEHTGTATTPLGFDGQYTSSDTGLIYLRARVYDPATAQFLSVDPEVQQTGAPYSYAGDDPINGVDPTGLCDWDPVSGSFGDCVGSAVESVVNDVSSTLGSAASWVVNNSQNISAATGVAAEIAAATGFEPVAGVLGAVSAATGAIAAGRDVADGKPVSAIFDAFGAALGFSSVELAAHSAEVMSDLRDVQTWAREYGVYVDLHNAHEAYVAQQATARLLDRMERRLLGV